MSLTVRDELLLRRLGDFSVLSTGQIGRLFFAGVRKTTMLRRLRVLEGKHLVRRIRGLADGSHGWCLTKKCATQMGFVGISRNTNPCTLTHDVTLSQVRLSLQSVGVGLDWVPEHVLRFRAWQARQPYEPKPENIPDATLILQRPGHSVPTALELEMTVKSQARYEKTFRAYRWKQEFGCIWYLVPSISIGNRLEHLWLKGNRLDDRFRWSVISQITNSPYDTEIYFKGGRVRLRDKGYIVAPPAHTPAHSVSSLQSSSLEIIQPPTPCSNE